MYFRCFGFVDTFAAVARLHRYTVEPPLATEGMLPAPEEWRSLQGVLHRAKALLGVADIKGAAIVCDRPQAEPHWVRQGSGLEFVLPLVTNPLMLHYRRHEQIHMPTGMLFGIDCTAAGAHVNWGEEPTYHLVFYVPELSMGATGPVAG